MVRLKVFVRSRIALACVYFNSTMVRLKGDFAERATDCDRPFQFHYGTIKSRLKRYLIGVQKVFQFHYGTIKRQLKLPH